MSKFQEYFVQDQPIEQFLDEVFSRLKISLDQQIGIRAFLAPLQVKDRETYRHTIRVGLLTLGIAHLMHIDQHAMFYAGVLHDVGKVQTPLSTLQKTSGWTDADTLAIRDHVMDGYRLIRDKFDFSAEVILWHHKFQRAGYPDVLPPPLHEYSLATQVMIPFYGRLLSLADTFDALHRVNEKHGPLTGDQIKIKMFEFNPDQKKLLGELFDNGVFTTVLI
jgi:putative nucleotidyltransferase with HDIG domain